ncbi:toxin-antitoxin system YwqK family antitoxin [Flagellimonas eckloniae]|uniref:Uncharacterized protein n=1 Tax=Flagellimonas eckloniae TaxID=346185 RepID=A0A0N8WGC0_9FLAO|nr:hypothetical protein [Allomuricauda eckloniae]KQC31075.1 hypothetical protein AAY42_15110 [Allomuricauda eckloniae]
MKKTLLFLIIIIFFSCKDDISNKKFRNSKYAFYQEDGKSGEWIKVIAHSEIHFPKSKTTYFFDNGNRYAELNVLDSFPNRVSRFYDTDDNLKVIEKHLNDSLVSKKYLDGYYKGYYSNKENLKSEGIIKNNKQEGKWIYYQEDGETIDYTIHFIKNLPDGERKDYYDTGELKVSIYYKEGKKNGKAMHYYKNERVKESKTYRNGKENGNIRTYYEDGSIEYSGTFWNGIEVDSTKKFYPSGALKQLFICKADTIKMHFKGKLFVYYESGVPKSTFSILNSEAHGKAEFFDKKGNLTKSINYDKGISLDSVIYKTMHNNDYK